MNLLTVGLSLGFIHAASAADIPAKAPIYKVPGEAAVYNWSGFYVGVNLGGAWNNSTWSDPLVPALFPTFNTNGSSFIYGGHLGYNYQVGRVVVGLEGDLQGVRINGSNQCGATVGTVCHTKQDLIASIRARLGATFDRVLVYGTGGVAFTRYTFFQDIPVVQNWDGGPRTGWTAGAGIEYAVMKNWIAGVQYSYYDFGTKTSGGGTGPVNITFKETESALTARLSYKF